MCAIIGVSIPSGRGVDLYTQLARNFRQLMSLFLPKPELSSEVTKAIFVLLPPPVESYKPIKPFVKLLWLSIHRHQSSYHRTSQNWICLLGLLCERHFLWSRLKITRHSHVLQKKNSLRQKEKKEENISFSLTRSFSKTNLSVFGITPSLKRCKIN